MAENGGMPPKVAFYLVGPVATLVVFGGMALLQFEGQYRLYVLAGAVVFAAVEYLLVDWLYERRWRG